MDRTRQLATKAVRRALLRRTVSALGVTLTAGVGVGLALVTADRVLGLVPDAVHWGVLVGLPALLHACAGAAWAYRGRPDTIAAVAEVDRALRLDDRLSSALAL
ncbi:MAG: hypothetical protein AAGH64_06075, partial [Planctomycetota bacterium]